MIEFDDVSFAYRAPAEGAGAPEGVRGIDLRVEAGRCVLVCGASGCGKTTTGRTLLRLYEPTDGTIIYDGKVLFDKKEKIAVDMLPYRRRMQIVFQDPYASLDPRMTIGDIVGEGIDIHHLCANAKERHDKIISLLERVGLNSEHANRYPHEFSGGMRQRVVIAIAVACSPKILICDEPTTALDVTIQAQILQLLKEMRFKYDLTIVMITHDLGVVANIADRVAVMYAGDIVEIGTADEIYYDPRHPYTWALLSSMPQMGVKGEDLFNIVGTPPNLFAEIRGDAFAPRNPQALKIDFVKRPPYFEVTPTHKAKTWLLDPRAPKIEPPAAVKMLREEGL